MLFEEGALSSASALLSKLRFRLLFIGVCLQSPPTLGTMRMILAPMGRLNTLTILL